MGDEEFTKEEKEILGESTEEEGQETQDESEASGEEQESKTEQSTESTEVEEEQAEENLVPQSRVDQIVREREDLKRKNDLLKRDPDAYQKLYPDEFEEEAEHKVEPIKDFVIQDGPYAGTSLSDLYQTDAIAANEIHWNLLEEQKAEKEQRKKDDEQSQEELNKFSETMAQEMFGKKLDDITDKEGKDLTDLADKILDWMLETKRGGGNIADAYFLMNKEKILANAAEKGVKTLIDTSSTGVKTVSTKKDTEGKSGYDKFTDYTAEQLATHMDNLTDIEADKFVKDAPQELKDKFPKAFAAWE